MDEGNTCELRKEDDGKAMQMALCVTNPMLLCKYSIDAIASFFFFQ
jgi:hypothetical protein